jgi:hypothetical protein
MGNNEKNGWGISGMRFLRKAFEGLLAEQEEADTADDEWADRRLYVRFSFDGAEFPLRIGNLQSTLRLRDLSCGGASAICETPLDTGDIVYLELDKSHEAPAEVLWVRQVKIGLRFVNALDPILVRKVHAKRRGTSSMSRR